MTPVMRCQVHMKHAMWYFNLNYCMVMIKFDKEHKEINTNKLMCYFTSMKMQDLRKMQTLLFLLTKGTALNYDTSWSCTFPPLMAMLIWSSLITAASCTSAGLSVSADGTVSVTVEVVDSSFSEVVDVGLSLSC